MVTVPQGIQNPAYSPPSAHQMAERRHSATLSWLACGDVSRRNPALPIALGILLLVLGFIVPGPTRELILRVAGALALLAGVAMWAASRRR